MGSGTSFTVACGTATGSAWVFAVTIEAVEEDMVEFFFGSCCEEERSKEGEDE